MPSAQHITRIRQHRLANETQALSRRAVQFTVGCLTLLALFFVLSGVSLTLGYANLLVDLPNPEHLPALIESSHNQAAAPTRLYDRTGNHLLLSLENPDASGHTYLPYDPLQPVHLPRDLIDATITALDPEIRTHPGFMVRDLFQVKEPSLAQRLVSDLLLWQEPPSARRVLRQNLLAAQITNRYGREQVVEWFLNSADFGNLAYGADAAARAYFGKPATQLSLAQSAALAALVKAPAIDPAKSPQIVQDETNRILKVMLEQGMISPVEHSEASAERLNFRKQRNPEPDLAPVFSRLVLEQVGRFLNEDQVRRGGYQVITTLDYDLQLQSDCAARTQLNRLKGQFNDNGTTLAGEDCQAARLLPTFPSSKIPPEASLAANIVVLDPTIGEILAMVGEDRPGQNPAREPGHPPGTLITPFVYLTSFSKGYGPATLLWDIPARVQENLSEVENLDGIFHGPVRLRTAMANDYLVPAAQVFLEMGRDAVRRTARQLGISTQDGGATVNEGLFEGGENTPLEIAQAYGVFANQGVQTGYQPGSTDQTDSDHSLLPSAILKVMNVQGSVSLDCQSAISECAIKRKPLISAQLAYLINNILSDEPARWPSLGHPNPLEIGRPAGAKLGQTPDGYDTWTVGYTPRLIVSVWLGNTRADTPVALPANWAAGLWHAIIQYANQATPAETWQIPPGISRIDVCDPSGLLPSKVCPRAVSEVFLEGNEPINFDSFYQVFQVNRETGHLATIFSPAEKVEERTYFVVPEEAETWSIEAGLNTPPKDYDVIESLPASDDNAVITSPGMFSSISGLVPVMGTASGPDFEFYRIQAGQGLNPTSWLAVTEDVEKPVIDGELADWETGGLDGLYALQLLVVGDDMRVKTSTVQVTIDNQPPTISIQSPVEGQVFPYPQTDKFTILAEASDNLDLDRVEFYLDGNLLSTLSESPFVIPWSTRVGEHRLRIIAFDRAGNSSEESLEFAVKR